MRDLTEYHNMKAEGKSALECLTHAKSRDLSFFEKIRMLREVFDLSLKDAKEDVLCDETGCDSLDSYQASLFPGLEKALEDLDKEDQN